MKFYNTVLKNGEKNEVALYINQITAILYRKEYSFSLILNLIRFYIKRGSLAKIARLVIIKGKV